MSAQVPALAAAELLELLLLLALELLLELLAAAAPAV